MKKIYLLLACLLFGFAGLSQQKITGDWYGVLHVEGIKLDLVFHIAGDKNDYTATMDSPSQGATDIPVSTTDFVNDSLSLKLTALNATYRGHLQDGLGIKGTFAQNGRSFPLNLSRQPNNGAAEAEVTKRPQEPKPPYPYITEEVTFDNKEADVSLAGTLTLPAKTGSFPALVLISGSGPQNRDEEIFNHKPFLIIADYLTRRGIAVLRYDDRGVGGSTGKFQGATTSDFSADAKAAVTFLRSRHNINAGNIGLLGHSEGGMIAPMIAATDKSIAFIVLLAAPGMPIDEMMLLQKKYIEEKMNVPEEKIAAGQHMNKKLFDIVKTSSADSVKNNLESYLNTQEILDDASKSKIVQTFEDPWLQAFLKYNPQPVLKKVSCPVLALNGAKDLQVPAAENLEAIRDAFAKSGNKKITINELPSLNHLFQHAGTGLPSEYGTITETFSSGALKIIGDWVAQIVD